MLLPIIIVVLFRIIYSRFAAREMESNWNEEATDGNFIAIYLGWRRDCK